MSNASDTATVCKAIFDTEYKHMEIDYVLSKYDTQTGLVLKSIMHDSDDPESIKELIIKDGQQVFNNIAEWDFNIDEFIFDDLENDFNIVYIPLLSHYNLWCSLDEIKEEVVHTSGMQKYLSYCQRNNITPESIASLEMEKINVMPLYQEMNGKYKIIADTVINNEAIVLAHNPNNPSPYVTWKTNDNRSDGYRSGNYFVNLKEAYKDFETRGHEMLKRQLDIKREIIMPKRSKEHER